MRSVVNVRKKRVPFMLACAAFLMISKFGMSEVQTLSAIPKPSFEVATVKPSSPDGKGMIGFLSYPGGRVAVGNATLRMLIHYAYNVQEFQIVGGPDWTSQLRFDVNAIPPETSASRKSDSHLQSATPTQEQRRMLQSLLEDRFGLRTHETQKTGSVYFLVREKASTDLKPTAKPDADPRGGIGISVNGIPNGDAFGLNLSMDDLCRSVAREVGRTVVNKTDLKDAYDFRIKASEPNTEDALTGLNMAFKPLGLKITTGKDAVTEVMVDGVTKPTAD